MDEKPLQVILSQFLDKLGLPYDSLELSTLSDGSFCFNITTKSPGLFIGTHGDTISALNHIVKKIIKKTDDVQKIIVDVNGYLQESSKNLKNKALMLAERAKSFKASVEMEPMSSFERMQVHSFLTEDPHIETHSIGEGRERRVVIKYKE